ncbi:MAG: hypothetical protein ABIQ16_18705 [Polyangiaceae bacterium]
MNRALARVVAIGAGSAALLVGLVGFAHTSAGRPLLGAVTRMAHGGCPFGYDKPMSPEQRERANVHFATTHRGERLASSRPALGFTLDHTTRPEIVAHFAAHGITCTQGKGLSDLTCNGVPSSALPGTPAHAPARNLWLTFGTRQQLLSVIALSRAPEADAISAAFIAMRAEVDHDAGAVTATHGNADPQALAQGALNQASAEFRFRDYYAIQRATNLTKDYVLTEEYRSLAD